MLVPAAIIRAPCLRPSEPVMPCTITRLSAVRKIAISCSVPGCSVHSRGGQLGGAPRRVVHGGDLLDHRQGCLGPDPAALGRLVAIQPDHDGVPDLLAALGHPRPRPPPPECHPVTTAYPA